MEPEPGEFPQEVSLVAKEKVARAFESQTFAWEASALYHNPLYFEDMPLERYGHSLGCLTPIWSAGLFGYQTITVPYQLALEPPCEKIYALGYYRPGNCAPRLCYRPPLSAKGGLYEAVGWSAAFLIIP
jgi:hypothetical protein